MQAVRGLVLGALGRYHSVVVCHMLDLLLLMHWKAAFIKAVALQLDTQSCYNIALYVSQRPT
jgi:hypothetical protein